MDKNKLRKPTVQEIKSKIEELEQEYDQRPEGVEDTEPLFTEDITSETEIQWKEVKETLERDIEKWESLVWYSRANIPNLIATENYEVLAKLEKYRKMYPEETSEIDENDFSIGFYNGLLAAARFILSAMTLEFVEAQEIFEEDEDLLMHPNGKIGHIWGGLEQAEEEFPDICT